MNRYTKKERDGILLVAFMIIIALGVIAFAMAVMVSKEIRSAGAEVINIKVFNIAEAGRAKARWALTTGGGDETWSETDIAFGGGTYTVSIVDNGDDTYTITSDAYIPDDVNPDVRRRVVESNIPVLTISGPNLSLTAVASASATQGGFVAGNAKDGDSATKWKSNVNNGSWLKLDYGSAITFDKVIYDGKNIDSYTITYSNDDVTYLAVANAVESPAGTVNFDAVTARYLRFNVNGNRPELNELESYNTAQETQGLGQGAFSTSW